MTVYVSIGSLSTSEARDDIVYCLLQAIVFGLLEIGRRRFQPFGKIRVPKDTGSPIPIVANQPATMYSLIECERVDVPLSTHLRQLMEESDVPNQFTPFLPEATLNSDPIAR